jgi:hypothetical protein
MVKLRRFGVATSSGPDDGALAAACAQRLVSAGLEPPMWLSRDADGSPAPDRGPLDFVLDFSGRAAALGRALRPRFGVWSFELDAYTACESRVLPVDRPCARAALGACRDDGRCVTLQEGVLPVWRSYHRTHALIAGVLASWPSRAVADIESGGWDVAHERPARQLVVDQDAAPLSVATRIRLLIGSPRQRMVDWWSETARYDIWNIGIATLPRPLADVSELRSLGDIEWLAPRPPLYFVADPFPYRRNGRDELLVEEYGHAKGVRGRISRVDLDGGGATLTPAIARPSHLSYPFTFEDRGDIYCAAEMGQEDGCVLYRLDAGGGWEPRHHILRGRKIVDPTFTRVDDRWWLFCTDSVGAGSVVLNAFCAEEVGGPWTPHRLNPLKSDLRSARGAGRPFSLGSRLYRPAQDCSRTYGGAVNVMEIVELGPTRFRETLAARLEPDAAWPYPHGLHHLVVDGCRVYIDAKRRRRDNLLWLKAWLGPRLW